MTISIRKISLLQLLFVFSLTCSIEAASKTLQEGKEEIRRIEVESEGDVIIDIPDAIIEKLFKDEQNQQRNSAPVLKPGINKISGFRIQVFGDGHNQVSLESRARARGNAIVAKFPKYRGQIYAYSSAPNWYTRVGNFKTQNEASSALAELKRAFPQFASEMRVVKSQIVVIK